MKKFLLVCLFPAVTLSYAQRASHERLKVYIDCSGTYCDMDYIRTEINIVDFLLDRIAADVHILITTQSMGGGGTMYQLIFYGQNLYQFRMDTLWFGTDPMATAFEVRERLVRYIQIGLAPMVIKTVEAAKLEISMKSAIEKIPEENLRTHDNWNYWIFELGLDGSFNADQVYKSYRYGGDFSVNRTTDKIKVGLDFFYSENNTFYDYESEGDSLKYKVLNHTLDVDQYVVKSVNDHWSVGYELSFINNTFANYEALYYFIPQVEWSFYPYDDVNTHFITLRYGIGLRHFDYYDTTIYGLLYETRAYHQLNGTISYNQKWGTITGGVRFREYFHDLSLYNVGLNARVRVRLTGRLSFYLNTYTGFVHDQINLVLAEATQEEVLTRRRQLQSSYDLNLYFGINYRFGSMLNNFVNPRFFSD